MADELIESDESNSNEVNEEITTLKTRMNEAIDLLKDVKLFKGKNIYQLPWYIMIGPPGAGKTTVIHNSGLDYPLKDKLGVDLVHGVGGTRNCDWWFTNKAVLIDTAGRYTTQKQPCKVTPRERGRAFRATSKIPSITPYKRCDDQHGYFRAHESN
ncbi:hypothetical protein ACOBV9_18305 (plasmid) [Pseudoalteromonas espejiana]